MRIGGTRRGEEADVQLAEEMLGQAAAISGFDIGVLNGRVLTCLARLVERRWSWSITSSRETCFGHASSNTPSRVEKRWGVNITDI